MFVFKIGKVKHKFKLKFTISKFKYQPQEQIQKNCLFKVKFTRGSHSIEIFSLPVKKQSIKFPKTEYMIPLTLFYDESDKVYLEKDAEVKSYVCDQNGNVLRTIGKTQLNISQYANNGKFALQVQVDGEDKKLQEQALITFHLNMQRQDDDSKSVNTYSQDQSDYRAKGSKQSKQQAKRSKSKNKTKGNLLFPLNQSNMQSKSVQQKIKTTSASQIDDKYSHQQKIQSKNKKQPLNSPYTEQNKKPKNRKPSEDDYQNNFFDKIQKQNDKKAITHDSQQNPKKPNKKQQNSNNPPIQSQQYQFLPASTTPKPTLPPSQLNLYLTNKKLLTLQKQNQILKKQSLRLKSIIQQLLQQKNKKQITEQSSSTSVQQQIQYYKKIIIQKEMKINELEGLNKIVVERETQKERELKEKKMEIKEIREKLEKEKNKVAKLVQAGMESGNTELLELLERQMGSEDFV